MVEDCLKILPANSHSIISLIAGEIPPNQRVKRFNSSARLKSSTTVEYKTVKNFSSADGTNLQFHALSLQTEHHADMLMRLFVTLESRYYLINSITRNPKPVLGFRDDQWLIS